jgi:hypothetical protein
MNGNGNPNVHQSVKYQNDLTSWHFIYFGYSRAERKAFGFVKFPGRKEVVKFDGINHYLAKQFYVNVGKDQFYPSYSGYVAHFRIHLCKGAYDPEFPTDVTPPSSPTPPTPPTPTPITPFETSKMCFDDDVDYLEVTAENVSNVLKALKELQA